MRNYNILFKNEPVIYTINNFILYLKGAFSDVLELVNKIQNLNFLLCRCNCYL